MRDTCEHGWIKEFGNCPECNKAANGNTLDPLVRLPRRVLNALEAASEALEDLGACDDPDCRDDNCNHALTKVRDVLAEQ